MQSMVHNSLALFREYLSTAVVRKRLQVQPHLQQLGVQLLKTSLLTAYVWILGMVYMQKNVLILKVTLFLWALM